MFFLLMLYNVEEIGVLVLRKDTFVCAIMFILNLNAILLVLSLQLKKEPIVGFFSTKLREILSPRKFCLLPRPCGQ